jgi:hypothetical protein
MCVRGGVEVHVLLLFSYPSFPDLEACVVKINNSFKIRTLCLVATNRVVFDHKLGPLELQK